MTLDGRIAEAESALHDLNIGKRVAKVSRNGKSIEFTQANRSDLERYINQMKSEKAGARRRPMGVFL